MKYTNKIINLGLVLTLAAIGFACKKETTATNANQTNSNAANQMTKPNVIAATPTEAYQKLFAACKAKDVETIKGLMSKGSMGIAAMMAGQQKKPIEAILENGLVSPTLSDKITEIRDERIVDNIAAVEVYNERDKRWEDIPFVMEDGGWKLAVGDIFANTYDPQNKMPRGKGQLENQASNKAMPMPMNAPKFPDASNVNSQTMPTNAPKSVEVPKEKKP